jgi:hypothetical protein
MKEEPMIRNNQYYPILESVEGLELVVTLLVVVFVAMVVVGIVKYLKEG